MLLAFLIQSLLGDQLVSFLLATAALNPGSENTNRSGRATAIAMTRLEIGPATHVARWMRVRSPVPGVAPSTGATERAPELRLAPETPATARRSLRFSKS